MKIIQHPNRNQMFRAKLFTKVCSEYQPQGPFLLGPQGERGDQRGEDAGNEVKRVQYNQKVY